MDLSNSHNSPIQQQPKNKQQVSVCRELITRRTFYKKNDLYTMISCRITTILRFRGMIASFFFISVTKGFVLSSPTHGFGGGAGLTIDGVTTVKGDSATRPNLSTLSLRTLMAGLESHGTAVDVENSVEQGHENDDKYNVFEISNKIVLPFSTEVAFDAFSDLPRQASWSPWLRSVEYVGPERNETIWKLKRIVGISYRWRAITRKLDRPNCIEWESTKGLKNFGRVSFRPIASQNNETLMTLNLSFAIPRVATRILGKNNRIAEYVKIRMVGQSLKMFRDIVMEQEGIKNVINEEDEDEEEQQLHLKKMNSNMVEELESVGM